MIARREDENLISIDEVIIRAQKLGVDFGNGDPRNRLRYYTKIGLLPYAQRKSFNNNLPQGAYPADVVELVVEIDRQLKNGKSIQKLKRKIKEKQEEKEETLFKTPLTTLLSLDTYYSKPSPSSFQPPQIEKKFQLEKKIKPHFKLFTLLKIAFVILISGTIIFFAKTKINIGDLIPSFLAAVGRIEKLAQLTTPSSVPLQEEILVTPLVESYLTINAETAINSSLDVKESVNSPAFIITKGNFKGFLTSTDLTTDRTYTFPNQSGTICLSAGNCIGLGGEVITSGGSPNRIAKFITAQRVGNSSIEDLYAGVSITISPVGKVGIGIKNPAYALQVEGRIQASGDVCTDLKGGKCLSQLVETPTIIYGGGGGGGGVVVTGGGIGGAGSANYLPIWTNVTSLGNSILYQNGANIGIGTTTPSQKLDVFGTIKMLGFQLPTNATSNYVLTSDASGVGTWQPPATGTIPVGTAGQTLRNNGVNWVADSFLYNTGASIGIGTTSALATLTIAGDELLNGPLTVATSTLPQLTLKYDDNNYLRFSINATQTEILSSKTMVINSLTGEIRLGNNVNLFNATSSTVWGRTFISPDNDSTVRKVGELVLRNSTPIFRYPVSSQTASTTFIRISKYFPDPLDFLPPALPGTTRKFAFLINFADDIATNASSTWRVYRPAAVATTTTFYFAGQNLPSLEEGTPHLSSFYTLPTDDWQLEVKVPPGNTIRIFNILLLTYDQVQ